VTVTDANGCTAVATAPTITQPSAINNTTSKTNVTCFGGTNGTAGVACSGGVAPYGVVWTTTVTSPPAFVASFPRSASGLAANVTTGITGLVTGTYIATITDANGCTKVVTIFVSQPSPVAVTITNIPGSPTSSATAVGSGGTPYPSAPYYTFLWSNGQTTQTATGLVHGQVYTVTIKDSKWTTSLNPATLCTATGSTGVVVRMANPAIVNSVLDAQVFPNPTDGKFTLSFNGIANEHYNIVLRDYTGRIVAEKTGVTTLGRNQVEYDLGSTAKGIYVISLERGSESGILRIVVQ
jgi:hypothetical protein